MNRLEEMDTFEQKRANAKKTPYKSIFEGQEDCRGRTGNIIRLDKMLIHVRDVAIPFIKNIHDGEKTLFAQHMKDAVFMIPKPSLLQEAVAIIDDLKISAQNQDTQGDIYEYLSRSSQLPGKTASSEHPGILSG